MATGDKCAACFTRNPSTSPRSDAARVAVAGGAPSIHHGMFGKDVIAAKLTAASPSRLKPSLGGGDPPLAGEHYRVVRNQQRPATSVEKPRGLFSGITASLAPGSAIGRSLPFQEQLPTNVANFKRGDDARPADFADFNSAFQNGDGGSSGGTSDSSESRGQRPDATVKIDSVSNALSTGSGPRRKSAALGATSNAIALELVKMTPAADLLAFDRAWHALTPSGEQAIGAGRSSEARPYSS